MALKPLKLVSLKRPKSDIDQKALKRALDYIDEHWSRLERHNKEDTGTLVGLPYPYIVPAAEEGAPFHFEEQ